MIIKKVLNNNVAVVINEQGHECVIIGKGITFGRKKGETIDTSHAVKMYKSSGQGLAEKVSNIIEGIPFEHIKVCNEIVAVARKELGQVNDNIFLTLIDHISFAIDRHKQKMDFADTLWEIRKLYPEEHRVGLMALDVIENRLNIRLPASEATFIAFHLLNANGTSMENARTSLKLIKGILDIVQKHMDLKIDEDTTQFARFMTHLRFFAGRINDKSSRKQKHGKENKLLQMLLSEMPTEIACVDKIAKYVRTEFDYNVSDDEKSCLIIHIYRILSEKDEKTK